MEQNIFDAAGKHLKKAPTQPSNRTPLPKGKLNPEIEMMLNRMRAMQKDLEDKLSHLYAKGEEYHIDVGKYFGDALHQSTEGIKRMQEKEREIRQKIVQTLPPESCLRPRAKSKEKLTQERKGKMRAARRNWIPMD